MNRWYATPNRTPRFTEPETQFVRFVAENYYKAPFHSNVHFLELGSGSGADVRFLERHKFDVDAVDEAPEAYANFHEKIEDFFENHSEDLIGAYDCIYDLNVLCCVERPPYEAIARALKPGGKFYSITPAIGTMADFSHLEYVRTSTPFSIRTALNGFFSNIYVEEYRYPHRRRSYINWVIEADK